MCRQRFADRPSTASSRTSVRFILPSSVAGSEGPTSKPTDSRYSRRLATKCSTGHCGGSSNSACPNTSAGGRFIAKEPPRLWQLTCGAPHCLRANRAFAIAIVTRRAETPVGWLGEERSDEYSAGRRRRPYAISTLISHSSANSCRVSEGPSVAKPKVLAS
jgi:hypothetical protein